MNFEDRLKKAVERGRRRADAQAQERESEALSEEELKRLHSQYRLQLSEHIEECLQRLATHFPGFRLETIYGDRGWGGACFRDDFRVRSGKRDNDYSRLEMTVRPFSSYHVVDLTAKGTIHNKEIFSRNVFEKIEDVDPQRFLELIDVWVLEYAEIYAAKQ
jgi:hypothetical protein